jgi:hypothetical protein
MLKIGLNDSMLNNGHFLNNSFYFHKTICNQFFTFKLIIVYIRHARIIPENLKLYFDFLRVNFKKMFTEQSDETYTIMDSILASLGFLKCNLNTKRKTLSEKRHKF